MDKREQNVSIFLDTEKMCKTNKRLVEAVAFSNANQYIVLDAETVELADTPKYDTPAKVLVSRKRSLEAASAYAYEGMKVCVHNFASATNPGGGVTKGSNAQEEAICRCSSLYFNISIPVIKNQFHNMHRQMLQNGVMDATYNDDCIYTPGVQVFKSDTDIPQTMPEEKWYSVDVITCAAPNLRPIPSNRMNPGSGSKPVKLKDMELMNLHVKRISKILDIAKKEGAEAVILGAFGCGAFCNSPRVVSEAMARVIEKYKFDFKVIEFAIYCSPRDTENYDVFARRLARK